jgi:hypothetical protein
LQPTVFAVDQGTDPVAVPVRRKEVTRVLGVQRRAEGLLDQSDIGFQASSCWCSGPMGNRSTPGSGTSRTTTTARMAERFGRRLRLSCGDVAPGQERGKHHRQQIEPSRSPRERYPRRRQSVKFRGRGRSSAQREPSVRVYTRVQVGGPTPGRATAQVYVCVHRRP